MSAISLPTALSLFVLGVGMLLSRPDFYPVCYLATDSLGASFFLRTWLASIFISLVLFYLRFLGEAKGYYSSNTGLAIMIILIVVLLTIFSWRIAQWVVKVEAQIGTLNENLKRSNRELEEFSRTASHDLQEPLRKVQAFSDILKSRISDKLDDEEKEFLNRIEVSIKRMKSLIEDLLSLARLSGEIQRFETIDLQNILNDVKEVLEIELKNKAGKIEIASLPKIQADPSQMHQLFQNLIGNALKFTSPERAPLIKIYALKSQRGQSKIEIVVEDNGIGFDQKYAEKIFIALQRLHGKNEYQGSGIGLSICKRVVERHQGSIRAESVLGTGARFVITLPLTQ